MAVCFLWVRIHLPVTILSFLVSFGCARTPEEEQRETASHQERRSRPPAFFPYGPVSLCLLLVGSSLPRAREERNPTRYKTGPYMIALAALSLSFLFNLHVRRRLLGAREKRTLKTRKARKNKTFLPEQTVLMK